MSNYNIIKLRPSIRNELQKIGRQDYHINASTPYIIWLLIKEHNQRKRRN